MRDLKIKIQSSDEIPVLVDYTELMIESSEQAVFNTEFQRIMFKSIVIQVSLRLSKRLISDARSISFSFKIYEAVILWTFYQSNSIKLNYNTYETAVLLRIMTEIHQKISSITVNKRLLTLI